MGLYVKKGDKWLALLNILIFALDTEKKKNKIKIHQGETRVKSP